MFSGGKFSSDELVGAVGQVLMGRGSWRVRPGGHIDALFTLTRLAFDGKPRDPPVRIPWCFHGIDVRVVEIDI